MRKKQTYCLNPMSLGFVLFAVLFIILAGNHALFAESQKPRLYFKAGGTLDPSKNRDLNDFGTTNTAYYNKLKSDPSYTVTLNEKSSSLRPSGELGLEVKKFAIGVFIGAMDKQIDIDFNQKVASTGAETHSVSTYKFTSVPIYLLFHYKLVQTSLVSASFSFGQGIHITKFRNDYDQSFKNSSLTFSRGYMDVKKNQIGFHVGTTIDLNINQNIAVFVSGAYRFVKSERLTVNAFDENDLRDKVIEDAILYYGVNKHTGEARFLASKPDQADWNFQEARFKLSGFVLSAGIKITLGSLKKSEIPKTTENE